MLEAETRAKSNAKIVEADAAIRYRERGKTFNYAIEIQFVKDGRRGVMHSQEGAQ